MENGHYVVFRSLVDAVLRLLAISELTSDCWHNLNPCAQWLAPLSESSGMV